MKNYYEILEVDKLASPEIIDKAYKTLAKRYHPDMHEEDKKEWAEDNFKKINEAFEILSDEKKRADYDAELAASTIDYSAKYEELCRQQDILKQELEFLRQKYNSFNIYNNKTSNYSSQPNDNYNNEYQNIYYKKNYDSYPNESEIRKQEFDIAYHSILSSLSQSIKKRKSLKDILAFVMTIITIVFVCFLLWNIPFTKNYLILFYEENSIIKNIVDFFIK